MTPSDIVTEMLVASDQGDFERFRQILDPDCEWVNPVVAAAGADAIAGNVAAFMGSFRERRHDVSLLVESGEHVAVEGEWVATHESGRAVRAPFAAVARTRGDRVTAVRLYLDPGALAAQLAPAAAGA